MNDSENELRIHKVLQRQIKRYLAGAAVPAELDPLVRAVSNTYTDFDSERTLNERSMQIASDELREQNAQLRDQTLVTETLLRISHAIAAELDLQKVVQRVLDESTIALKAEFGAFIHADTDQSSLAPAVYSGNFKCLVASTETPALAERVLPAFEANTLVRIADTDQSASCPLCRAWLADQVPVRSYMAIPVMGRDGQRLGVLAFGHPAPDRFCKRDEALLLGIGKQAAVAIDNARLHQATLSAAAKLAHQALHDDLTGLPNRTLFQDRVQRCIERRRRVENYHFAVLFLDLDRFKVVNDTLGHAAGDALLKLVSATLIACLRSTDTISRTATASTVARVGGDEFTVLLEDLHRAEDAEMIAQRLIDCVAGVTEVNDQDISISTSIGIAHGDAIQSSSDDLLRDADAAMYYAKAGGKARYAVFDSVIHNSVLRRLRLEAGLRFAIARNEMRLVYQPIVNLESRIVAGFEALLRWNFDGKPVSPAEFIPIAEDAGIIVAIGEWVLDQACSQLRHWQDKHPRLRDLTMSVNLSRRQLVDPDLVPLVKRTLTNHGICPRVLKLEVTETMMMQDHVGSAQALSQLREMGIGIQLDDFGTGYSSLSHIHTMPLDALKIDRSFVASVAGRRDCVAVLHAMVTLAHNLNMKVVAEGLEQPEQVVLLQALDCDLGQGYFFAKPLEPQDALRFALASKEELAAAG